MKAGSGGAVLLALGLLACGDQGETGGQVDTPPPELDSAPPATDTAPAESDSAGLETDAAEHVDATVAPDSATAPPDAAPEVEVVAEVDSGGPTGDPATCPVPSMSELYPPPLPPFPYGPWPPAEGCLAQSHDVIIVLGCPSEEDGSASSCQIERALIATELASAGWASRFIVSGAAVHNAYVEAEALRSLLVTYGADDAAIFDEPRAEHTDENIYYATRIMEREGWTSALVVSDDPGHLMMAALCDANCCVDRGRLTLHQWEVEPGRWLKAGHYATIPPGPENGRGSECDDIGSIFMCINLEDRRACKDRFELPEP